MKRILPILIFSLWTVGCGPRTGRTIREQLAKAERVMQERPDSALQLIQGIDAGQIGRRAVRAKYALLYAQALDKNAIIDVDNDSLIRIALDYYRYRGSKREKAWTNYYWGCELINNHRNQAAIIVLKKAERYAGQIADDYLLGQINSQIGSLYLESDDYREAIRRFERTGACFRQAGARYNEAMAAEKEGHAWYMAKEYAVAMERWDKARKFYAEGGGRAATHTIECCQISLRLTLGEAIDSLKADLHRACIEFYGMQLPPVTAGLWMTLYKEGNQLDSARLCGEIILANASLYSENQLHGCYAELAAIEEASRNYTRALDYLWEFVRLRDSAWRAGDEADLKRLGESFDNRILREILAKLLYQHRAQRLTLLLIALGAIGVAWVTWRIARRVRSRAAEERAQHAEAIGEIRRANELLLLRLDAVRRDEAGELHGLLRYLYAGFSLRVIGLFLGISINYATVKKSRLKAKIAASEAPSKREFLEWMG